MAAVVKLSTSSGADQASSAGKAAVSIAKARMASKDHIGEGGDGQDQRGEGGDQGDADRGQQPLGAIRLVTGVRWGAKHAGAPAVGCGGPGAPAGPPQDQGSAVGSRSARSRSLKASGSAS